MKEDSRGRRWERSGLTAKQRKSLECPCINSDLKGKWVCCPFRLSLYRQSRIYNLTLKINVNVYCDSHFS